MFRKPFHTKLKEKNSQFLLYTEASNKEADHVYSDKWTTNSSERNKKNPSYK